MDERKRFPAWLHKNISTTSACATQRVVENHELNTVCESARCPNKGECYSKKKATFLILGNTCTRTCSFCSVPQGVPNLPSEEEPFQIAQAVAALGLVHVVITSVARDDLADGGAQHFVETVAAIKQYTSQTSIEVLTPDFLGNTDSLDRVCAAPIDIFNHNLETIERLYPTVRPEADYERSLSVLRYVHSYYPHILTKSGIMVGLGERDEEVFATLNDLKKNECDILTIGQYLQPTREKTIVQRFVTPEQFNIYKNYALAIGFRFVYAAPFVRSSYNADAIYGALHC